MAEQFVGCIVSIEAAGGLGFYQGLVKGVNTEKQLITLTKVLHNGKLLQIPEVSLRATDIVDLSILHTKEQLDQSLSAKQVTPCSQAKGTSVLSTNPIQVSSSTPLKIKNILSDSGGAFHIASPKNRNETNYQVQKRHNFKPVQEANEFQGSPPQNHLILKKKTRTSVGETLAHGNLAHNEYKNDKNFGYGPPNDYMYQRRNQENSKTPNRKLMKKNYRDETTFGTPIDEDIHTEFDFEKNLALFNKQAVMEEIQGLNPDVIRQAVGKTEKKYRCDENIIAGKPAAQRQIIVPGSEAGEMIYATDNGLLVPSVSNDLRLNLLSTANQHGLTKSRQLEMIGRAATEIIISVIGGSHRLEPGNSHQPPVVVLMCGANMQGAAGTNCARQLESQSVQTVVVTPTLPQSPPPSLLLAQEIKLYLMTKGKLITDANALPDTVDLIVDARFDLLGQLGVNASTWITSTNAWALTSRAPIVALDSPVAFDSPLTPRIRLCPSLPLSHAPDKGKVYLLNLNIPQQIFDSLGIKYTSPFGAKMVIPLHPCE